MTPSFICILNGICAAYCVISHATFWLLVFRLKLSQGHWPGPNDPDPKYLPIHLKVHGSLLDELVGHTFLAFLIWSFLVVPISIGLQPGSPMVRRTVAASGLIWLLGAIMIVADPGQFLKHWYID